MRTKFTPLPDCSAGDHGTRQRTGCWLCAALLLAGFAVSTSAVAQQSPAAAKPDEPKADGAPQIPPPRDIVNLPVAEWFGLMERGEEFDRIYLGTPGAEIFDVERLEPRPLPLRSTPDQPLDPKVRVRLIGSEGQEFELERRHIKTVKHFEDMLLDEGQKYLLKGDLETAFDFYQAVVDRQPHWPGLDEKVQDFLSKEATFRLSKQDDDRALHVLHELRLLNPNYPETEAAMTRAVNRIVELAFDDHDYRRGRHYLAILQADYPQNARARELRAKFVQEAQRLVRQAKEKEGAGQARDACYLVQQAAQIWPSLPELSGEFDRIFRAYPILRVGVRELPDRFGPWAPAGSGDARVAQLLHLPLMEVSGIGQNTQFDSRVAPGPKLEELNRRVRLDIKPGLRWSDGEKPITAMDVARSITARCDARLPSYDAALASAVAGVSVPRADEVVVDLKRIQLRPHANFLFNLAPGHRMGGEADSSASVGAGPFRAVSRKAGSEAVMQANQNFFGGQPKLREIVEQRYASGKDAVNALLEGDTTLIEHVPATQLHRLRSHPELHLARGGIPALHVISFDFRRYEFHSRTLRRAMAYAIDRRAILDNALLRLDPNDPSQLDDGSPREGNELASGPFPKGSYAYYEGLEPLQYDPVLAKGLVDVAKKELDVRSFRFTLHYPDTEEARESCKFIKTYLQLVGIEIELQARPLQALEEEIALGRRFDLVYRIHYVRDPLLDAARVLCLGQPISPEGMAMPNCASAWLRQTLRELEFATGWPAALEKLMLLQHHARNDVAVIPLWQLTDYYAYHERLHGFPDGALAFYQDSENWQVDPWFPQDTK